MKKILDRMLEDNDITRIYKANVDTRRLFEWNLSLPIGISIVCGFKGKSALTFALYINW
jgi:hypothetical protein